MKKKYKCTYIDIYKHIYTDMYINGCHNIYDVSSLGNVHFSTISNCHNIR
jgi:hypothetical protein